MRVLNDEEIKALPRTMIHGITVIPEVVANAQHQFLMKGFVELGDELVSLNRDAIGYATFVEFWDSFKKSLKQLVEK